MDTKRRHAPGVRLVMQYCFLSSYGARLSMRRQYDEEDAKMERYRKTALATIEAMKKPLPKTLESITS